MNFSEILATFIGRTVEVIQANQFLQGQLCSAKADTRGLYIRLVATP